MNSEKIAIAVSSKMSIKAYGSLKYKFAKSDNVLLADDVALVPDAG